jgi:hypothetical protein
VYRQTTAPVINRDLIDSMLAALTGRPPAALIDACLVGLFTAGPGVLDPTNVVADFTPATFVGYSTVDLYTVIQTNPPINTPDGRARALIGNAMFVGGAIVPPGEVILGYFVTWSTNTKMVMAEIFTDPVAFALNGDFLSLDLVIPASELITIV